MIIETLQQIRKVSLDLNTDPVDRIHQVNRLVNELLVTLQASRQEAAQGFIARLLKLLPPGVIPSEDDEYKLTALAEAFLEGATSHKLQQISLVAQNHSLLVTQRLTRIESILGDQP